MRRTDARCGTWTAKGGGWSRGGMKGINVTKDSDSEIQHRENTSGVRKRKGTERTESSREGGESSERHWGSQDYERGRDLQQQEEQKTAKRTEGTRAIPN